MNLVALDQKSGPSVRGNSRFVNAAPRWSVYARDFPKPVVWRKSTDANIVRAKAADWISRYSFEAQIKVWAPRFLLMRQTVTSKYYAFKRGRHTLRVFGVEA